MSDETVAYKKSFSVSGRDMHRFRYLRKALAVTASGQMGKGGNRVEAEHIVRRATDSISKETTGSVTEKKWLEIEGKRYDITNFSKVHPGGHVIDYFKNRDATEAFLSIHTRDTLHKYKHLLIKENTEPLPVSSVSQKFRDLEKKYREQGLFEPKPFFFFWQLGIAIALWITSIYVYYQYSAWWTSCIIMAVSQVQFGWLMHDFGHRQVTCDLKNDRFYNSLIMNFFQGGNSEWWTSKHNRHHLLPNTLKHDPDIHTDPLFSFTNTMMGGFWNKYQHIYFPILGPPLGVVFMAYLVIRHAWNHKYWGILSGMIAFNTSYFLFFGPLHYIAMRVMHGIWFQSVVAVNHFAEAVLTREEAEKFSWVELVAKTTMNVEGGLFMDWAFGHLNYQIEHHLFPQMPRVNYRKVAPEVRQLMEAEGVTYESRALVPAFAKLLSHLAEKGMEVATFKASRKAKTQ